MYNRLLVFLAFFLIGHFCSAEDINTLKTQADSAFTAESFDKAAELYLKIAKVNPSEDVCYNLGCTYYRLDNMSKSVLWFERAALLDPADDDIHFNLEMARSKTIDKITPRHEMFFVTVYRSAVNLLSVKAWTYLSMLFFVLCLTSFALYLFSSNITIRKSSFTSAISLLLMVIMSNVFAAQQKSDSLHRNSAIIMSPAVTVKSTPAENGNDLFVLHEGTKVLIQDDTIKEWCEVRVADGKVGWVPRKSFEII